MALGTSSLIRPLTGIGQYTSNLVAALECERDLDMQYFFGYEWSTDGRPRDVPHMASIKKWFRRLVPSPTK